MRTLTEAMRHQIDALESCMQESSWPQRKIDQRLKILKSLGIEAGSEIQFRLANDFSKPIKATVKSINADGLLILDSDSKAGGYPFLDPAEIRDSLDYITRAGVMPEIVKNRLSQIAKAGIKAGSKLSSREAIERNQAPVVFVVKNIDENGLIHIMPPFSYIFDVVGYKWQEPVDLSDFIVTN